MVLPLLFGALYVTVLPAVLSLIVVMLPWMVRTMIEFTRSVIEQMPQMVG